MKKLLVGFLSVFTVTAFAQTSTAPLEIETPKVEQSKGMRVTLIKPVLEQRISSHFPALGGATKSTSSPESDSVGLGIGWGNIPVRDLGWTLNASYIDLGSSDTQEALDGIARLDGNIAYGINEKLNIKGGANWTKYTQGDVGKRLRPGTGAQASIGFQVSKLISVDAGYTFMTFGGNNKGGTQNVTTSGGEVSVTGTF